MNEKRIRDVIEIERQAQEILVAASKQAEQLPIQAEAKARDLVEQARASATEEAKALLARAQAATESEEIIAAAKLRMGDTQKSAEKHVEEAIGYVLHNILGEV